MIPKNKLKTLIALTITIGLLTSPTTPKTGHVKRILNSLLKTESLKDSIFPEDFKSGKIGITDDPAHNKVFYWFFAARNNPATAPLVIWFTGGPGCSSELAVVFENGPFTLNRDFTVTKNPYSWNVNANLLYIDQPIGTGFSEATEDKYAKDQAMVKAYFVEFFQKWLQEFPEFKGRPLYITGESYAGHYIPQIGNALFLLNSPDVNLKGLAIGNGWTTPVPQNVAAVSYLYDNNNLTYTKGYTKADFERDLKITNLGNYDLPRFNPFHALGDPSDIVDVAQQQLLQMPFNKYDIRIKCEGDLCYNLDFVRQFFIRNDVQQALGVNDKGYQLCNNAVGTALGKHDHRTDAALNLIQLVEAGLEILFYTGEYDLICNWYGTVGILQELDWSGQVQWNKAKDVETQFGVERRYMNLRFIKFKDSGHMVPHDQPELALKMLNQFIQME